MQTNENPFLQENQPTPIPIWLRIVKRSIYVVFIILVIAFLYILLLMGEPTEPEETASIQQAIQTPINAMESIGESDLTHLASTFNAPVLALYSGASLTKTRIYDSAFANGFARHAIITYTLQNGATFTLESIRPSSAIGLLRLNGYTLSMDQLYIMAGLEAGVMQNEHMLCYFTQQDDVAYVLSLPASLQVESASLLAQTTFIQPTTP